MSQTTVLACTAFPWRPPRSTSTMGAIHGPAAHQLTLGLWGWRGDFHLFFFKGLRRSTVSEVLSWDMGNWTWSPKKFHRRCVSLQIPNESEIGKLMSRSPSLGNWKSSGWFGPLLLWEDGQIIWTLGKFSISILSKWPKTEVCIHCFDIQLWPNTSWNRKTLYSHDHCC